MGPRVCLLVVSMLLVQGLCTGLFFPDEELVPSEQGGGGGSAEKQVQKKDVRDQLGRYFRDLRARRKEASNRKTRFIFPDEEFAPEDAETGVEKPLQPGPGHMDKTLLKILVASERDGEGNVQTTQYVFPGSNLTVGERSLKTDRARKGMQRRYLVPVRKTASGQLKGRFVVPDKRHSSRFIVPGEGDGEPGRRFVAPDETRSKQYNRMVLPDRKNTVERRKGLPVPNANEKKERNNRFIYMDEDDDESFRQEMGPLKGF